MKFDLKIKDIKEGGKYGDTLFFRCVEEEGNVVTFRFFPRPYNGNDLLVGFTFVIDFNLVNNWNVFVQTVVLHPEFIRTYWKKYRNGFHTEKYYRMIVEYFSEDFDDCPERLRSTDFGRLRLPEAVRKHLEVNDVDIEAWMPNK